MPDCRFKPNRTEQTKSGPVIRPRKPSGHPTALLTLQRTVGNRAVQRLFRARTQTENKIPAGLKMSAPQDRSEREADHIAEKIMRMPAPAATPENLPTSSAGASSLSGGGRPLPASARLFFESRFGHDFGGVRLHTDASAAASARSLDARAYTVGREITFGAGQYQPETSAGRRLLAHELTHVVQQEAGAGPMLQRQPACNTNVPPRTIDVFVVQLPGSTRNADADITRANAIWHQCSISINMVGGESWDTAVLDRDPPTGVLNAPSGTVRPLTAEETEMTSHKPGGRDVIHAYFIPDFSGPKVAEAFWPTQHGQSAVIVADTARTDSFAHELGHVLRDNGDHETDPDNLMASGSIRNVGVDKLECRQCR